MTTPWPLKPLGAMAEIRVSNVDKKIEPVEKPVRLCNYMDVYSNIYVTRDHAFMHGSASPSEVERFTLKRGDVVITKDSETPDDIGISAVIVDDIPDLVCGYHLALIRPQPAELDSVFLAKQLATARVARFFGQRAAGSTRYGLPTSAIESVSIPAPPKPEQEKIAEVLTRVDQAIEQGEKLLAKRQRIKTGLLDNLLSRGIDDHDRLRSEQTHTFKDSPLGRIPREWMVKRIGQVFTIQLGKMLSQKASEGHSPFPYLGNKNVQWDRVDISNLEVMDFNEEERRKFELRRDDILVCEGGEIGRTCLWRDEVTDCYFQKAIHRLRPLNEQYLPALFPRFMRWAVRHNLLADFVSRTSIAHLTQEQLGAVPIALPDLAEQRRIVARLDAIDHACSDLEAALAKLIRLRTGLMHDLLTGRIRLICLLAAPKRDMEQVS